MFRTDHEGVPVHHRCYFYVFYVRCCVQALTKEVFPLTFGICLLFDEASFYKVWWSTDVTSAIPPPCSIYLAFHQHCVSQQAIACITEYGLSVVCISLHFFHKRCLNSYFQLMHFRYNRSLYLLISATWTSMRTISAFARHFSLLAATHKSLSTTTLERSMRTICITSDVSLLLRILWRVSSENPTRHRPWRSFAVLYVLGSSSLSALSSFCPFTLKKQESAFEVSRIFGCTLVQMFLVRHGIAVRW